MVTDSTQREYTNGNSQVGARDGLEEQVILLAKISEKLDDYFSLRTLR
jgi:hypothetical protein